ncbi:MAG: 3-isopropylmalate dehydratase large subunit [Betaproteobacteria bacterium]|nr:3-isopropylmalate dehydratase large subunit [Betaproteobacteria bacterium]
MFARIWRRHSVLALEDGESLIYVDRCLIHEGSRPAFQSLDRLGKTLRCPAQVIACADHYVPTTNRERGTGGIDDPAIRQMVESLEHNARRHGCTLIGLDDPRQGILHVVAPEQGITQPGMMICGGDSHTATHGAFGALAFGIGASEVMHVMATQTLWQEMPRTMRITVNGHLAVGASAKDLILSIIARIGTGGATGHVIEYAGPGIRALSMEQRMTVCNMSIEAGARAGMIAPDDTTFEYLAGRPAAPAGALWQSALEYWRSLPGDIEAQFDREVRLEGTQIVPMASWGTSPEQCVAIGDRIPDPLRETDGARREAQARALEYMALQPNQPIAEIAVDRVFIGSCTNARIEDLREAAAVLKGRRSVLPGLVVPGSSAVKRQAEAEGLDYVFQAAGLEWRESGCSLCTGVNGADFLQPGERCASTSNRNFPGRQGPGSRTHLMSPASVAATATLGRIASVRDL